MKAAQQALVDALLTGGALPAGLRGSERGLAAYRNNLKALSGQALAVPYGRVHQALGADDFAVLAWSFWRAHPPRRGDLAQWGGALAAFLAERAGEASGLPDLARLDWAQHEVERAADVELDAASLALLGSQPPDRLQLCLRPAVRLIDQQAGPVLVWRQGWQARHQALAAGDAAFIRALQTGVNLDTALVKGLDADADFDFSAWLQAALHHSWLHSARLLPDPETTPP